MTIPYSSENKTWPLHGPGSWTHKIRAIKEMRERYGLGLKNAKELVDLCQEIGCNPYEFTQHPYFGFRIQRVW